MVDHQDFGAVQKIAETTRVALNFAGPFARYGESVIAACANSGTHYLDITGETLWVGEMREKYEDSARKSGAILIPFSGFDSIPSDLGAWYVQKLARKHSPSKPLTRVLDLFSVKGGFNGGTYQTLMDLLKLSPEKFEQYLDPANLVPTEKRSKFLSLRTPVQSRSRS